MEIAQVPAFILTAGLGTRLRPFTNVRPKPCIPFLGLPLFNFPFSVLRQAGCKKFFFNLHYQKELVKKTIIDSLPMGQSLDFFEENQDILGSGGALWNGRQSLKQSPHFFVAPSRPNLISEFYDSFKKSDALASLLVTDHPELLKSVKPVWINEYNEVVGFGMDRPSDNCQPVHYTGFKVFSSKIFDYLPDGESNIFYDVIVDAISKGEKVTVFRDNELMWSETGNIKSLFKSLKLAFEAFKNENHHLLQTLRYFGKNPREYILEDTDGGQVLRHKDTFIPTSTELKGYCFFDRDCKIGIKAKLHNVITEPGAVVLDQSVLNHQIVFGSGQ